MFARIPPHRRPAAVLLALLLALPLGLPSRVAAADDGPRLAILFVAPELGSWEEVTLAPRIAVDAEWYMKHGYSVRFGRATPDRIERALLNPQVRAISYFGHGGTGRTPTLAGLTAAMWRQRVQLTLQKRLSGQGFSPEQAYQLALKRSQNLGLEVVANHSCHSLADPSLAHQLVAPGGSYYGVSTRYVPCPNIYRLLYDSSMVLDEYPVPAGSASQGEAEGETAETGDVPTSGWCVWYADNIGGKPVMLRPCQDYPKEHLRHSYPGGGTQATTEPIRKVMIAHGPDREAARQAACRQFGNIRIAGRLATWTTWFGDRGGERHDLDELGGCK
jgi:hypothetical protein